MNFLESSRPKPSNICSSFCAPNVVIARAWVWPLVNNALPCVLGRISTLADNSLISSIPLPSGLICSLVISLLTSLPSISSATFLTNFKFASKSSSPSCFSA